MDVFITIGKLIPEFVGAAFNLSGPPSTNVVDGSEGFLRSLVYRKGSGEILILHVFSLSFGRRCFGHRSLASVSRRLCIT